MAVSLTKGPFSGLHQQFRRDPNVITGIRIVMSAFLLFCPAFSPAFSMLYIAAGASDMIDGAVARKAGTVSGFGSRLDTIADIVFVAVCLKKVLPVLDIPIWLCIWIAIIAFIKAVNIIAENDEEYIMVCEL